MKKEQNLQNNIMQRKINSPMHKKDEEEKQKTSDKVIHNLSSSSG